MRRSVGVVLLLVVASFGVSRSAASQDSPFDAPVEDRLDDLEREVVALRDEVADLERRLDLLEPDDTPPWSSAGGSITVRGFVEVVGVAGAQIGGGEPSCWGLGEKDAELAGLSGGDSVWVYVGDTVVATGTLETGRMVATTGGGRATCVMAFRVNGVPEAETYAVAVGDERWFEERTRRQMEAENWYVGIRVVG